MTVRFVRHHLQSTGRHGHSGADWETALVRCSELKLQRQLDRAWAADLIERVEARTVASGQAAGQRLRRLLEQCVGQVVVWRTEVRVVEERMKNSPRKRSSTVSGR